MTEPSGRPEYTDVNEAVSEEWESETTPYERIRQVISHTYEPVSAAAIAETARTSPKTARKHLSTLVDEGFVASEPGENGATLYRRSPESLVLEQAADILDRVSTAQLAARVEEMRETLREYRAEYGVESPEELTVEQTTHALSRADDSETGEREIDPEARRDWQTTRRNLAFANAALAIATAERFVEGDDSAADGSRSTV